MTTMNDTPNEVTQFLERIVKMFFEAGITDPKEMGEITRCIVSLENLHHKAQQHGHDSLTDNEKQALQIFEDMRQQAQAHKEQSQCTAHTNGNT